MTYEECVEELYKRIKALSLKYPEVFRMQDPWPLLLFSDFTFEGIDPPPTLAQAMVALARVQQENNPTAG